MKTRIALLVATTLLVTACSVEPTVPAPAAPGYESVHESVIPADTTGTWTATAQSDSTARADGGNGGLGGGT
ncbi:MAG: hypothetical protein LC667_01335 [Thioalkalivibrio sp.]|nr:hypothetical protein [Thioalkalivibrio sp.]